MSLAHMLAGANAPGLVGRTTLALALVLTGLAAGFFYTYEASVTLGLAQVDNETYVLTFQAINDTIRNGWFGTIFFGAVVALGVALGGNWTAGPAQRWLIAIAAALYAATLIITFAGNIPLNDELATYQALTPEDAAQARRDFEDSWNTLNLWRTATSVGSFACLVIALAWPSRSA